MHEKCDQNLCMCMENKLLLPPPPPGRKQPLFSCFNTAPELHSKKGSHTIAKQKLIFHFPSWFLLHGRQSNIPAEVELRLSKSLSLLGALPLDILDIIDSSNPPLPFLFHSVYINVSNAILLHRKEKFSLGDIFPLLDGVNNNLDQPQGFFIYTCCDFPHFFQDLKKNQKYSAKNATHLVKHYLDGF